MTTGIKGAFDVMLRFRIFVGTFGIANAGLILYGSFALWAGLLMSSFSQNVYQFPVDAFSAISYLSGLFRLLGFLNLLLGIIGSLLLWRYQMSREYWLFWSASVVPTLSYLGPIIFDNIVGTIGLFEIIEHIIFATMIFSGIRMIGVLEISRQEALHEE